MAYADFVTAMMAFFLVMWIVGQDQKIKRSVADYFADPFATAKTGGSKKAIRTGSVSEFLSGGVVPDSESVALGNGRNAYSVPDASSLATKLVSDWLHTDLNATEYWWKQAESQREQAAWSKNVGKKSGAYQLAAQRLAKQMQDEVAGGVPSLPNSLYKDLLFEVFAKVNWTEIAEDLLAH